VFSQVREKTTSAVPPAPVDPEELARALAPFGSSRMLPRSSYLDPAVLAWEQAHLFSRWICVGRSSQLPRPRTAKAVSVGANGVLLTRDAEGELHAFENACRHRGHELLPCGESAEPKAIVCPYHAWTYGFDGDLRGAPGFKGATGFEPAAHSLFSMAVTEWHGYIFVDRTGAAGDLADHIGDLEGVVAPYGMEHLVTAASHEYDVEANWKVIVENYQECYHCSMIHPELCKVSPPESGENLDTEGDWVGGWMELRAGAETMSLDGRTGSPVMARLEEEQRRSVMYAVVLPNLLISLHPDYVMTHLLMPVDVGRTHIQCSWAFLPDAVSQPGFDPSYAVDFWDITNRQDWNACESVQRGMAAPHYTAGPLAPAEDGVYQFVTHLARAYQGTPKA